MPDLGRHHGMVDNTAYRWKAKYDGMEISKTKRLREPEQKKTRLPMPSSIRLRSRSCPPHSASTQRRYSI